MYLSVRVQQPLPSMQAITCVTAITSHNSQIQARDVAPDALKSVITETWE